MADEGNQTPSLSLKNWQYRVMASRRLYSQEAGGEEAELTFSLHEVWFDQNDVPVSCTSAQPVLTSDTLEGLTWTLEKIREALDKPILWDEDDLDEYAFPDEYEG